MAEMQWIEVAAGEAVTRTFVAEVPPTASIAGWHLRFTVYDDFGGAEKLTKTPTITDPTAGTFAVALTSADTYATLGAGNWVWEAWRIDSGGEARVAFGRLVVSETSGVPA
jgi:hypothetical protein